MLQLEYEIVMKTSQAPQYSASNDGFACAEKICLVFLAMPIDVASEERILYE